MIYLIAFVTTWIGAIAGILIERYLIRVRLSGPHISLKSPCPACGHKQCKLGYDSQTQKVNRVCQVCGCTVTQPPVFPNLFQNPNQRKT